MRGSEVTDAALNVFNNFLDEIARVTPLTATMKERTQTSSTQLRRSARLMDPGDFVREAQFSAPTPIVGTLASKNSQKVCTLELSLPP